MPDLNLVEENGFDEASEEEFAPTPPNPYKKKPQYKARGGGAGRKIIIIFLIFIILGGGAFLLYQQGIIKNPFKKKKPPIELQDDQFAQDQMAEDDFMDFDTTRVPEEKPNDSSLALIETPSIEEKTTSEGEEEKSDYWTQGIKLSDMRGDFTIQIIAYSEKAKAVEISENLIEAGYPAFVEKVPMKGGEWFAVRIGRYPTKEAAEKAVQDFPDELKEHYVIEKILNK